MNVVNGDLAVTVQPSGNGKTPRDVYGYHDDSRWYALCISHGVERNRKGQRLELARLAKDGVRCEDCEDCDAG